MLVRHVQAAFSQVLPGHGCYAYKSTPEVHDVRLVIDVRPTSALRSGAASEIRMLSNVAGCDWRLGALACNALSRLCNSFD